MKVNSTKHLMGVSRDLEDNQADTKTGALLDGRLRTPTEPTIREQSHNVFATRRLVAG
jgi:hypothetical protein